MPFIPAFDYDVYICFADVDNVVLPGAKVGWIDQLVDGLSKLLNGEGIKSASVRASLEGNSPSARHVELLQVSATVVVVLSPAYFDSDWTRNDELASALRSVGASRSDSVFVVEKAMSDRAQGATFDAFRRDEFWTLSRGVAKPLGIPDLDASDDQDAYYEVAIGLAQAIARRLRALASPAPAKEGKRAKVYLAEATEDMKERRAQVQRALEQAGIDVKPRGRLPEGQEQLALTVSELLDGCGAFIQVLGEGDPAGTQRSRAQLDVALAHSGGRLPILQWRDESLDLARIADPEHKALLLRATVRAETLTDFCRAAIGAATHVETSTPSALPSVFVDSKNDQLAEVQRIFARYSRFQWAWHQPTRKNLKTLIRAVDGVIIYWGTGESDLTQERYLIFVAQFKALRKRLDRLLIYDGPPPDKPRFKGENFPVADGRDGQEPVELRRFLQELSRVG